MKRNMKKQFLRELEKVLVVQVACKRCNLSRQTVYRWRQEDSRFAEKMERALQIGEDVMNDLCESKILSLANNENFQAIKFWLTKRHPRFKEPAKMVVKDDDFDPNEVAKALGLTESDFSDDRIAETRKRIFLYLRREL